MKTKRSICPINYGLEIFGDKWTLLIVRDILMFNKRSFKDFLLSGEGIATNILTDRLLLLEREMIVNKEKDAKNKSINLYSLTNKGMDLAPMLLECMIWSGKYDSESPLSKKDIAGLEKSGEKYLKLIKFQK